MSGNWSSWTPVQDRSASLIWGTITFSDPDYTLNFYHFDSDGITSALQTGTGTYEVNGDGSILIHELSDPDGFGQLSPDGNVLFASFGRLTDSSMQNGLGIAIKEASGYTRASLAGDYYITVLAVHDMAGAGRDADLN